MVLITSYADFVGELAIGQIESIEVKRDLDYFREKYEKEYLISTLGSQLYEDFMAGLNVPNPEQKWLELRSLVKLSLCNYVYCKYHDNSVTATVGSGEAKPALMNARVASVIGKQVRAWNEMVNETKELSIFMHRNKSTYESYSEPTFCNKTYRELISYINQFNF